MSDFDLPEVNPDVEIARILKDTEAFLSQHSPQRDIRSSVASQVQPNKQLAHAEPSVAPKSAPAEQLSRQAKFSKVWIVLMVVVLVAVIVGVISYTVLTGNAGDSFGEW